MNKFLKSFKDKRFKYGTYSTVTALIVIAVLVAVNLIIGQLDIKLDLTSDKLYSISDKTKEMLSKLDDEVTVYALFKTGEENSLMTEMLEQYENGSSNIHIEYKDPYIYPQFTSKYAQDGKNIETQSLIVEKDSRFKVIPYEEIESYDYYTGASSFNMESKLTAAIQYVAMDASPIVYCVTGHNEMENSLFRQSLQNANYEVKDLNIIKEGKIPDDCSVLVITSPETDYSKEETDIVKDYLANDGRAALFLDYFANFPNLKSITEAYGVEIMNNVVYEGNEKMYYQHPCMIMPEIIQHEATQELIDKDDIIFDYVSQSLKEMDVKKNSVKIEPLLKTSDKAYAKEADSTVGSLNYEEGDEKGSFNLALAVTDSYYTDTNHETRLVIIGSGYMLSDEFFMTTGLGNKNITFAVNALNWLNKGEKSIYIPAKSLNAETIVMDSYTGRGIIILVCIVLPIAVFGAGVTVWLRRRNR